MRDVAFKAVKTLLWHAVVAARWWALGEPSDVQKICKGDLRLNKEAKLDEAWMCIILLYWSLVKWCETMQAATSYAFGCFWQVWPCPLCWASASPCNALSLYLLLGPKVFHLICVLVRLRLRYAVLCLERLKKPVSKKGGESQFLQASSSVIKVRNSGMAALVEAMAGPMNLRSFHSAAT